MEFWQLALLGVIQGIVEWMPISSEGQIVLILINIANISASQATALALFLHLGTACVVLVVYWRDYRSMVEASIWKVGLIDSSLDKREDWWHLSKVMAVVVIGTALTAIPSVLFLDEGFEAFSNQLHLPLGEVLTGFVGLLLIITGFLLLFQRRKSLYSQNESRSLFSITLTEAFFLGLVQGFAALPGLSRSGLTIAFLLSLNFAESDAIRGSFLISFFASVGASVLLFLKGDIVVSTVEIIVGGAGGIPISWIELFFLLVITFLVGLASMKVLVAVVNKIPYPHFCIAFGGIAITAAILGWFLF